MSIKRIIIHCAATPNGRPLHTANLSAAKVIDGWHKERGFKRSQPWANTYNTHLGHIGYHYVIDTNGVVESGRGIGEIGAHTRGYNTNSIGICLVGTNKFTIEQWLALDNLVTSLKKEHYEALIYGHRDFAAKECPGFNVDKWLALGRIPLPGYLWGSV